MDRQFSTLAVRTGQYQDMSDAHSEPIAMTSAYVFSSAAEAAARFSGARPGNVYARFTNPTVTAFEQRLAALEGAEDAVAFASGMAAISGVVHAFVSAGDNVVCSRDVFGTTLTAFRRYFGKLGVEIRVVSLVDLAQWQSAIDEKTRLVFLETPSNPMQHVADLAAITTLAHRYNALVTVDNTLLTPVFQRPLDFGADLVLHSAGKYIDGHGRCVAGVVAGSAALMNELRGVLRTLGPTLSAMNAWMLLKSLETLEIRMNAINISTTRIAQWLSGHERVQAVHYTGLSSHPQAGLVQAQQSGVGGGVLSFKVGDTIAQAWALIDSLPLISICTNIGDSRSMVTHPATTTHCRLSPEERRNFGISDGLVRLSVGLENTNDLIAALDYGLSRLPVQTDELELAC